MFLWHFGLSGQNSFLYGILHLAPLLRALDLLGSLLLCYWTIHKWLLRVRAVFVVTDCAYIDATSLEGAKEDGIHQSIRLSGCRSAMGMLTPGRGTVRRCHSVTLIVVVFTSELVVEQPCHTHSRCRIECCSCLTSSCSCKCDSSRVLVVELRGSASTGDVLSPRVVIGVPQPVALGLVSGAW